MLGIEGKIHITLSGKGCTAQIRSTRPVTACQVFAGKLVQQTLKTLPLLFNVCGQAQNIAAIRAIESQQQHMASPEVETIRDQLAILETLREHLWRILLDWPVFYHAQRQQKRFVELNGLLNRIKHKLDPNGQVLQQPGLQTINPADIRPDIVLFKNQLEAHIYGCKTGHWLGNDLNSLTHWQASTNTVATQLFNSMANKQWLALGASKANCMQQFDDGYINQQLDRDHTNQFVAQPHWQQQVPETGSLQRQYRHPLIQAIRQKYGHGLLARMLGKLLELAHLTEQLATEQLGQAKPEKQHSSIPGLAAVEAARGTLWHRVELDGDNISRYQILAPTEWNFHPQGVAAQALADIDTSNQAVARQQAGLIIHAIDPCVGYTLDVETNHA